MSGYPTRLANKLVEGERRRKIAKLHFTRRSEDTNRAVMMAGEKGFNT